MVVRLKIAKGKMYKSFPFLLFSGFSFSVKSIKILITENMTCYKNISEKRIKFMAQRSLYWMNLNRCGNIHIEIYFIKIIMDIVWLHVLGIG